MRKTFPQGRTEREEKKIERKKEKRKCLRSSVNNLRTVHTVSKV